MKTPPRTPRAFTLTELLVVISVIILLIAIALPAFSGLLRNSEESLADNQLRVAISAGRDAAIRSSSGDGAAVFFFTPGGRVSVVPCVQVGSFDDEVMVGATPQGGTRRRDIFVPMAEVEPLNIPKGWSVRAYAAPGALLNGWYENFAASIDSTSNWMFPETGFTIPTDETDTAVRTKGWQRQSFMVRFKAGSGELDTSGREALILDPLSVSDQLYRETAPWTPGGAGSPSLARQLAIDPSRFARMILSPGSSGLTLSQKRELIGDRSAETVLCRGVTELALYREDSLANALGVALNRQTGTLYAYRADDTTGAQIDPAVVTQSGAADQDALLKRVGDWLIGRYVRSGQTVDSDAKIYTVERYLGQVREIEASQAGEVTP